MTAFPQRRIVGALALIQVVGGVGNGSGLAVGSLLVKDVSGSSGWAGMATVMLTLGAAAVTMPLASVAISRGRRPALTLGWAIGALGAVAMIIGAQIASLPVLLIGLMLAGSSTATNLQSRFAAADQAPSGAVGRSLSLVIWSTTIGAVTGPNLTGPGASVARQVGIPDLAGPVLFTAVGFAVAGILTWTLLRPDPLPPGSVDRLERRGIRAALPHVHGPTLIAIWAIASSHAVMVAVMALTPVHMEDHGASLSVIGFTISVHIAGMFALSPVMGWLSDRWGARPTVLLGQGILLLAVLVAGTSGESEVRIAIGLTLLGLGWSASVVAGAAMLTTSVDIGVRPAVQGFSDFAMSLAGAGGGLLAGLVVALLGYGALNAAAGLITLPVIVLVLMAGRTSTAATRSELSEISSER